MPWPLYGNVELSGYAVFCLLNREAGCYPLRSERDSRENLPLFLIIVVNATMFDRYGDADDFLDCFIMPARIVGGTFQG